MDIKFSVLLLIISILVGCNGDSSSFKEANQKNSIPGYEIYLQKYPDGEYAQEAKTAIEILKFEKTQQINTIHEYENYIKEYPGGKFVAKAKETIEILKFMDVSATIKANRKEEKKPTTNFINVMAITRFAIIPRRQMSKNPVEVSCSFQPTQQSLPLKTTFTANSCPSFWAFYTLLGFFPSEKSNFAFLATEKK